MTTKLRIVENPTPGQIPSVSWPGTAQPGDMWCVPEGDEPGRDCWAIVLPNGAGIWLTIERAPNADNPAEPDRLWDVTGTPPKITVSPSINAEPFWHGSITNGVMSE